MPADLPVPVPGSAMLPSGFAHRHASEEARAIAERGLILRVQVGSGVHGTSITGQDDRDEMGLCLEPPHFVTGLARVPDGTGGPGPSVRFEQYERHTARRGSCRVTKCRRRNTGELSGMQPAGRGDRPTGMKAGDVTHPRMAARPLARAAVALAWVLAVASGLAAAGCAGSLAGAGSPVPAPAISRLTVIGSRAAKANGDAAPLWMTAVLTTHAKALTSATPGDFVPGAGGVPVFLVTMRGHFAADAASGPPGAAAPAGSYLSIVVDARTFQVLDSGLSPSPPPVSPASLGPVTYLTGHPH
jgi:hypothetical protein